MPDLTLDQCGMKPTITVKELAARPVSNDPVVKTSITLRQSEFAKLSAIGGGQRGKRPNIVAGIRRLLKLVED